MNSPLVIATRASPLAIYQAEWVKKKLEALLQRQDIKRDIALLKVKSPSYRHKDSFVKGCQEKVLAKQADIAVHSAKDMPIHRPPDLCIAAFCERGDATDVLVGNYAWSELPVGARVGTTSLRRKTHLLALRPDLSIVELRGNIETRLAALQAKPSTASDALDAIVLAAAGLLRLGYGDRIRHRFRYEEILPAPGQGAYGIECRSEDAGLKELVAGLNHSRSALCVQTERQFCRHIGGDCYAPLAAHACVREQTLELRAMVGRSNTGDMLVVTKTCDLDAPDLDVLGDPEPLGRAPSLFAQIMAKGQQLAETAAQDLLRRGAGAMLAG